MFSLFSAADWSRIRAEYEAWWNGTREQPMLHLTFTGADPGMPRPEGVITPFFYAYPADEPAEPCPI